MARISKKALIQHVLDAIAADGWTVVLLTAAGSHPARFTMERGLVKHTVRLYIWNLSHGGHPRSDREFRIQVTGIKKFEPEPNGRTLILGWSARFGVFAGFDVRHRSGAFGASPSIQITSGTLENAGNNGAAIQEKGDGERAVALRPDRIGRYVQHLEKAHSGNLDPILEADDWLQDPLTSELNRHVNDGVTFDLDVSGEPGLRAEVLSSADALREMLETDDTDVAPQMGHNQPPEEIAEFGDLSQQIEDATRSIKSELESSRPDPRKVGRSAVVLGRVSRFLREEGAEWVAKAKDLAREHFVKVVWAVLLNGLWAVVNAVLHWLQQITIF